MIDALVRTYKRLRLNRDVLGFAALVRNDLARRPYPEGYTVSRRWREILDPAMEQAALADDALALARIGMRLFDLPHEVVDAKRAEWFRSSRGGFVTRNHELARVSDTPLADPVSVTTIDGVTFSGQMEQAFSYYEDVKAGIGDMAAIKVIVEIGSGFGRFARVMHLIDSSRCYVLVDLPESLVFSHAFLRLNFPQARMKVITAPGDVEHGMTERYDFIFCPVHYIPALKLECVDLVVNTYSFAEMTQGCVNFLLGCVERVVRPRFLYSLNMVFTDKSIHFDTGGLYGDGNDTVLALQPQWWPTRFVLVPSTFDGKPRITGSVVLKSVTTPSDVLINDLRQTGQLGHAYLAALWSRDKALAAAFAGSLRRQYGEFGLPLGHFDGIGELTVLRRLARP